MSIIKIDFPNSAPVDLDDWSKSVDHLETNTLLVNEPVDYDFSGNTIKRGAFINIGGSLYQCIADEAISGTPSDYVRITPSGSIATAAYTSNLSGVSWNSVYNFYEDVSGNAYIFNRAKAVYDGVVTNPKTQMGKYSEISYSKAIYNSNGAFLATSLGNVVIGSLVDNGDKFQVSPNQNIITSIGKGKLGSFASEIFYISHIDNDNVNDYGIRFLINETGLNVKSGGSIVVRNGNSDIAFFNSDNVSFNYKLNLNTISGINRGLITTADGVDGTITYGATLNNGSNHQFQIVKGGSSLNAVNIGQDNLATNIPIRLNTISGVQRGLITTTYGADGTITYASTLNNSSRHIFQVVTGGLSVDALILDQSLVSLAKPVNINGSLSCTTLNTGQGNNELYQMNQDVRTIDDVVFNTVIAGNDVDNISVFGRVKIGGITDVAQFSHYDFDTLANGGFKQLPNGKAVVNAPTGQDIVVRINNTIDLAAFSASQITFNEPLFLGTNGLVCATVNTGQGDNELYAMDQDVTKASTVEHETMLINTSVDNGVDKLQVNGSVSCAGLSIDGNTTFDPTPSSGEWSIENSLFIIPEGFYFIFMDPIYTTRLQGFIDGAWRDIRNTSDFAYQGMISSNGSNYRLGPNTTTREVQWIKL